MGLQMTFLATFSQFLFAPVLWSFLDHDVRISTPDPKCAGGQYNSGIDTAVFLFRDPDLGYGRHITKPPLLTEMGGNNATLFHPRPTCVLQGAVRIDCDPVLLGQDRARTVKRDVVYRLPPTINLLLGVVPHLALAAS